MFNAQELFKQRLSAHIKELSRYGKYMFNGHIAIVLLFLISALAVVYQQWLAQLPQTFPSEWIIIGVFGFLMVYNPIRTLLAEADIVFLIAAEEKMRAYFRSTVLYSFVMQLYVVILVAAALGPLYFHAFPLRSGWVYIATIVLLLVFKAWNTIASWWMYMIRDRSLRLIDRFIRFLLSTAVLMFFIQEEMLFAAIVTILYIGLFLYVYRITHHNVSIPWDELIRFDQQQMNRFYRIAHLFTDVPHMKNTFKERKWIAPFIRKRISYGQTYTYTYLYRLSFLRSGDYGGMYIRLLVIGGGLLFLIPNEWMKLLVGLLFIYMSMFQLIPLYGHHRMMIWTDLYPVEEVDKKRAFRSLIDSLTWIQIGLFTLLLLVQQLFIPAVLFLSSALIFAFVFHSTYINRKLT